MKARTLLVIAAAMSFASCKSIYRQKSSDFQYINKSEIRQLPTIVDYEVGERVTGSYQEYFEPQDRLGVIKNAKEMALGNAIEANKCDFIIHPLYEVEIIDDHITVNVTGLAATYTEFRNYQPSDSVFNYTNVRRQSLGNAESNTPSSAEQARKKRRNKRIWAGVGIYLGVTAVVTAISLLTA